jgi:hypothetical protein
MVAHAPSRSSSKRKSKQQRYSQEFPLTTRAIRERELNRMFGIRQEFSEDTRRTRRLGEWNLCLAIMKYLMDNEGISRDVLLAHCSKTCGSHVVDKQVEFLMAVRMVDSNLRVTASGRREVAMAIASILARSK